MTGGAQLWTASASTVAALTISLVGGALHLELLVGWVSSPVVIAGEQLVGLVGSSG